MSAGIALPKIPQKLIISPVLSDEEFEQLCFSNPDIPFERTKEGEIVVNPPAGIDSSSGNSKIAQQLENWWDTHERGLVADSSAGFFLPDGSMRSPDAAYLTEEQVKKLTNADLPHFLHLAPAFVIELRSHSDSISDAVTKMKQWIENGVQLGWLIDPYRRLVQIFEQGKEPRVETGKQVVGTGPVDGFVLELNKVWRRFRV